jgi:hypothetical protein
MSDSKKGINLGNEMKMAKSTPSDALDEMREEQIARADEQVEVEVIDGKDVEKTPETEEEREFKGYTLEDFPLAEIEGVSINECYIPTSDKDASGRQYVDYLRQYDDTYELRMFGKAWRWSASDYEREHKVIFRKTVGYIVRSIKTTNQFLFVPKTNQLFPIF